MINSRPYQPNEATPLQSHEYIDTHPAYRPLDTHQDPNETASFEASSTADVTDVSIHRETEEANTPEAGPSSTSHQRAVSVESIGPLHWSPGRFAKETDDVAGLAEQVGHLQLQADSSAQNGTWVTVYPTKDGRISFRDPHDNQKYKISKSSWSETSTMYDGVETLCFEYQPSSGRFFFILVVR